jgi:GT2 family glycosyltransferase
VGVAPAGDVDALDGLLLVLSPWAVRELRCDTATFTGFHAYDVDLCLQARAAGRRVVAHPFAVFHHATTGKDRLDEGFMAADAALRRKWGLAPA